MTERFRTLKSDEVADQLRTEIEGGAYTGAMPSIDALGGRYKVSRVTMRNILLRLQAEGYVQIRHGSGVRVNPEFPHMRSVDQKPTIPAPFAEALGRYIDFLTNPGIPGVAKNRMIDIVDSQLRLVREVVRLSNPNSLE